MLDYWDIGFLEYETAEILATGRDIETLDYST